MIAELAIGLINICVFARINWPINELGKIKMQVKKLEIENSQLQKLAADVALLKKRYRGLK